MGYNTNFKGMFVLDKKVNKEFYSYINAFSRTRHVERDISVLMGCIPNWQENSYRGDLHYDGAYFAPGDYGANMTADIVNRNERCPSVPGLYCQWVLNSDNEKLLLNDEINETEAYIKWDGGEKFYDYTEWLIYLIQNFFINEGISVTGVVLAVGEEFGDATYICAVNNQVEAINAYTNTAKDSVEHWICNHSGGDKDVEVLALELFEDVYTSQMQLEYEWEDY